jgi:hypothetical protein
MTAAEVNRIMMAETIVNAYHAKQHVLENGNAAQFAEDNQDVLKLLEFAENLVNDG